MNPQKRSRHINKLYLRSAFFIILLIIQISIYVILWTQMITTPTLRTGMDFISYYTAGKIAQTHGSGEVYDIGLQQAVQLEVVGPELDPTQVLLYIHLPFTLPILKAVITPNYVVSFVSWEIMLLASSVTSIFLFIHSLAWKRGPARLSFIAAITFFPLFISFLHGQDSAFAVLGMAICFYGLHKQRDFLAGLGLALVTVRPHIVLLLAIPFIFRRRKVFGSFVLSAGILALFSVLILGIDGVYDFIEFLLAYNAKGEWYGTNEHAMFNFLGILVRAFPQNATILRLIAWGVYLLVIVGLSVWWSRSRIITVTHLGIATIMAILAATHLHFHDLALLLVPIFSLMVMLENQYEWKQRNAAFLPLIYSFILLLGFFLGIRHLTVYLVMLGLGLWLLKPEQILNLPAQFHSLKKINSKLDA